VEVIEKAIEGIRVNSYALADKVAYSGHFSLFVDVAVMAFCFVFFVFVLVIPLFYAMIFSAKRDGVFCCAEV
jgi:hypothetical protein